MHTAQLLTNDNIYDTIKSTKISGENAAQQRVFAFMQGDVVLNNKAVLVLFTGGTIGSATSDGVMDVDASRGYMLIEQYQKIYGSDVKFECRQILNTLSENITAREWETLCAELYKIDLSSYSGVIITHGSDTLAYTSALVGMLFRHSPVPIILIAANKPLDVRGTNGLYNFTCAVKLISDSAKGIYTFYEKVYLSTRLLPADTCTDSFSSYGGEEFLGVSEKMLNRTLPKLLSEPPKFSKRVLKISGCPDMDFADYRISPELGAVLYEPYHSGTACMRNDMPESRSFSFLADECRSAGIPLYICGVSSSESVYSSLDEMLRSDVEVLGKISAPAAYIKLLIGVNQNEYPLRSFMKENIYFEVV